MNRIYFCKSSSWPLIRKFVLIVLGNIIIPFSYGQHFKINFSTGKGNFSMADLKEYNTYILNNLPVKTKITDNFPSTFYYDASFTFVFSKRLLLGVTGNYSTTGSRICYTDYSGSLKYDDILSSYSSGIKIIFPILNKPFVIAEENILSFCLTKYQFKEQILTYSNNTVFKSKSMQIEPSIKASYNYKIFEMGAYAGYLVDFGGTLKSGSQPIKNNSTNKDIKSNWSGSRIGLSVGIAF